jgi:Protein of unknown function (DUF559)
LEAGVGSGAIDVAVQAGRLIRVHRGVYAVGHDRLTLEGRWMAAVLACGLRAALSHQSAGRLWLIRVSDRALIDVTIPTVAGRRHLKGIDVHTTRRLEPDDVTTHRGIPTTTPQRTLTDLAEVLTPRQLAKAANEAERLRLHAPIQPIHGRHGIRLLSALEHHDFAATETRSPLEDAFLILVERAGLPRPLVNHIIEGHECDFVWPQFRLIVETDGFATHGTRRGFRTDRARDVDLMIAGWRIARFTYEDVLYAPERVIASLIALTKKS